MLDCPSKSFHDDPQVRSRFREARTLYDEGDREDAKILLDSNVIRGCTSSMVLLGDIYADGSESERKESLKLFRQAADRGDSSGFRNLAYCYAIGLNVEKDKAKGAELYTVSAEMGNARSACNIGVMYDFGNGVPQNFNKAFHWYIKSAEGGYARGMTNLGEFYLLGKGTAKDVAKAVEWFTASGSPRALYHLCQIYLDEPGFKDERKAMDCLRRSAEGGYSRSMVLLGKTNFESDREQAIDVLTKAAVKGNPEAAEFLRSNGIDVPEPAPRRRKKTSD